MLLCLGQDSSYRTDTSQSFAEALSSILKKKNSPKRSSSGRRSSRSFQSLGRHLEGTYQQMTQTDKDSLTKIKSKKDGLVFLLCQKEDVENRHEGGKMVPAAGKNPNETPACLHCVQIDNKTSSEPPNQRDSRGGKRTRDQPGAARIVHSSVRSLCVSVPTPEPKALAPLTTE